MTGKDVKICYSAKQIQLFIILFGPLIILLFDRMWCFGSKFCKNEDHFGRNTDKKPVGNLVRY